MIVAGTPDTFIEFHEGIRFDLDNCCEPALPHAPPFGRRLLSRGWDENLTDGELV